LLNQKNQLLVKAVDAFVNERDLDIEVRFDIIAINKEGNSFVIEHLIDAFYHFSVILCCYICNKLFFIYICV
jgi:putative endonuclease